MKVKDIIEALSVYDSEAEIILFKEIVSDSGETFACECKRLDIAENGNMVQLFMNH